MKGFRTFILRGNVVDLAVGVVIGGAFGAVVASLVKDLITPFIAAIVGKPDFSNLGFKIGSTPFPIGDFINAVVSFLLVSVAIYFFIVLPVNTLWRAPSGVKSPPIPQPKNARSV
jgi:large conductance mechanosensitive channel